MYKARASVLPDVKAVVPGTACDRLNEGVDGAYVLDLHDEARRIAQFFL